MILSLYDVFVVFCVLLDDFPAIRDLFELPPRSPSNDRDNSIPSPPPLPRKPQRTLVMPLEEKQQLQHGPKVVSNTFLTIACFLAVSLVVCLSIVCLIFLLSLY